MRGSKALSKRKSQRSAIVRDCCGTIGLAAEVQCTGKGRYNVQLWLLVLLWNRGEKSSCGDSRRYL